MRDYGRHTSCELSDMEEIFSFFKTASRLDYSAVAAGGFIAAFYFKIVFGSFRGFGDSIDGLGRFGLWGFSTGKLSSLSFGYCYRWEPAGSPIISCPLRSHKGFQKYEMLSLSWDKQLAV